MVTITDQKRNLHCKFKIVNLNTVNLILVTYIIILLHLTKLNGASEVYFHTFDHDFFYKFYFQINYNLNTDGKSLKASLMQHSRYLRSFKSSYVTGLSDSPFNYEI